MKNWVALALCAGVALSAAPASADVIYTLNATNDAATSGAGPFATVDIHLIDSTHATATFARVNAFTFGEMGLDINASTFAISGLSFTMRVGDTQTPTYTVTLGGKVGGVGNFALDYVANPAGFSDSVVGASFNIQNTSGTWSSETSVLTASVPEAAIHAFNATGGSFFASGGPSTITPPPPPPPPPPLPEPASIALLGMGLLGLGVFRRRQPK